MSDMGPRRRLSLITVLFHSGDLIAGCITSAHAAAARAGLELEVILVDNDPSDRSAQAACDVAPDATLISNAENVGFARACNQGFEVASGQWWLLLNPDATLAPDALVELVGFASSQPRAAAVAPTLTGAGRDNVESAGMLPGLRSAIGHFWFVSRLLRGDQGGPWRGFQVQRRPELGPRQLEWASGGVLLLRPEAVRAVGGFDESYFLYAEDVDLGRRLCAAGWGTWLVPSAVARHTVAASSGGSNDTWFRALHDDHARHASRLSAALFALIAATGLAIRAILACGDELHRARMSVAARAAFGLAVRTLIRGTDP